MAAKPIHSKASFARWTLPHANGIDSLTLDGEASAGPLGEDEVAVELHAASLNYRELAVVKNAFPSFISTSFRPNSVPGSDGAGVVKAAGKNVKDFHPGDRVVTHLCPLLPDNQPPTFPDISAGLGHGTDGTLSQYAQLHYTALVHAPKNLSFREAATLTCSGLTAWNALFGLRSRGVSSGDWVLVQGTGGVSIAALQFAVAAGANVVATTSSDAKATRLKDLGATEVINYRSTPSWGRVARSFTPSERGFDIVVDIAGDVTLNESLQAVRTDGIIVAAGVIGGAVEEQKRVPMMSAIFYACTVRGILLGTREQFRDMVKFVEEKDVHPVIDEKIFGIRDVKEAYWMLEQQKHFSKIVIDLRP